MSAPLNTSAAGSCCQPQCSNSPQYQVPGPSGQNAFTFTEAIFVMPAVGGTVLVTVQNSVWMGAGNNVFIEGAGWFEVSSIPDSTHVLLINQGFTGNVAPGTNIGFPSKVVPAGVSGNFGNAYTTTTANFTMPASLANVVITMGNTAWTVVGAYLFIATAGFFKVVSVTDSTHVVAQNLGYPDNAAPTTVINSGQGVVPTGPRGASGSSGSSTLNDLSPTTTKGDLIVDNGANNPLASDVRFGVGSDGQALVADSSQATGRNNATITPNAAATDGDIAVFSGTTGKPMALKDSKLLISSTGAIQSTPSGGNARGTSAVDLQVTRGAVTQVASGDHAALLAGENNTASATDSGVAAGNGNTASNTNAFIGGGANNVASGLNATVPGGTLNTASGTSATVAGGNTNVASATNSSVGGGNNNTASASGAAVVAGLTNIASGVQSTVGGGNLNTASAPDSTVSGGGGNTASAQYSTVPGGLQAAAYLHGQQAQAAGQFAGQGDAQCSRIILRNSTTDATPTELFLDGAALRPVLPTNTAWGFEGQVVGRTDAGVCAVYGVRGGIKNNAGTATLVGSPVIDSAIADGGWAGSAPAITADGVHLSLKIAVTGVVATNIRWVANIKLTEVGY